MAVSREKLVKTAEKYVSRGKVEAAIKEYRKLLEDNPQDTNTLNRVGDLYARIQKFDEAVKLFSQIADQYTSEGFFVKAIAIFKKIIKLDPTRLEVYERLAELYHKQGLINEAKTQYQVLADYYVKHDNAASAISIFQAMVELEPEDASHHAKLAEFYQRQKLVDKAMEQYSIIADLMLSHGQVEQAVQVLQRALDVDPENLEFVGAAVTRLKGAGETAAAARFLAAATEKNPEARRLADTDMELAMPEAEISAEIPEAEASFDQALEDGTDLGADFGEVEFEEPTLDAIAEDAPAQVPEGEGGGALEAAMAAALAAVDREADAEEGDAGEDPFAVDELDADDFVLEWDDGVSDSIVMPPSDMDEGPGFGFQREEGEADDDASPMEEEGPASEFELELELEEEDFRESLAGDGLALGDLGDFDLEEAVEATEPEEPEAETSDADILSEAEVLAKYGLRDKAVERATEVMERNPQSLEAHTLLIQLHLEDGEQEDTVLQLAQDMAALAKEQERLDLWKEMRGRLEEEGYHIDVPVEADQPAVVEAPKEKPAPKRKKDERINRLLESLLDEAPKPRKKVRRSAEDLDALLDMAAGKRKKARPSPAAEIDLSALDLGVKPAKETAAESAPVVEPEPPAPEDFTSEEAAIDLPAEAVTPEEEEVPVDEASAEGFSAEVEEPAVEVPDLAVEDLTVEDLTDGGLAAAPAASEAPAAPVEEAPQEAEALEFPPAEAPGAESEDEGDEPLTIEQFLAQKEDPTGQEIPLGITNDHSDIEDAISFLGPGETPQAAIASTPDGAPSASLEDTGTSWLDAVSTEPGGASAALSADDLFDEEEGFFDLASELEEELDAPDVNSLEVPKEQSLEEIVEGFKQGVAEALSEEDFDTHFNLGIAYREMGLLDEAIGEFQLAAKDPGHLVQCCSMLGMCFLDKGLPELAVKWFTRALAYPEISDQDSLALLYDLGEVYQKMGDTENARKTFVEVYGMNINYRDIVAKLAELS